MVWIVILGRHPGGLSIATGGTRRWRCGAKSERKIRAQEIPGLESERRPKLLGGRVQKTAVQSGIERHAQLAVVVVAQGNEAERLKTRALKLARRVQHFGHTADGAGSGVESDFDEVSSGKLVLQLQQSAGDRNGL